ncbi:MAG TPA: hypothetical protein ENK19_05345 [Acidobacteria bacterium]|nr:hypothetical protein [Acidobacteriota bacterium]
MKILTTFEAEHELIEQVAGSLYHWATEGGDEADAARFATFFRTYSGSFHHGREDEILIPAIIEHLEIPPDSAPIRIIQEEHEKLGELTTLLGENADRDAAVQMARMLWEHIDKENSVLFVEAEERLPRAGVFELEDRPMTAEEEAALRTGKELIERYEPVEDPEIIRGSGCIICSAFTVTCRGIEAEWWNRWEWEEHFHKGH